MFNQLLGLLCLFKYINNAKKKRKQRGRGWKDTKDSV